MAKTIGSKSHMFRNRQTAHAQVSGNVGYSTIEKGGTGTLLRDVVRPNIPTKHQFGEKLSVIPGQSMTAYRHLLLNHSTSCLKGTRVSPTLQPVDQ
jgi:hypothetical protein